MKIFQVWRESWRKHHKSLKLHKAHHFVYDQKVENDCMASNEVNESDWEIALITENKLECMNENQRELPNLKDFTVWIKIKI